MAAVLGNITEKNKNSLRMVCCVSLIDLLISMHFAEIRQTLAWFPSHKGPPARTAASNTPLMIKTLLIFISTYT